MKKFVLVVEITIRMITVAHHYIRIIPISAFKLHSPSLDWNRQEIRKNLHPSPNPAHTQQAIIECPFPTLSPVPPSGQLDIFLANSLCFSVVCVCIPFKPSLSHPQMCANQTPLF